MLTFIAADTPIANANENESTPNQPVYQYTDRNGVTSFTNDPSHIPVQVHSTVKTVNLPPLLKIPDSSPGPQPQPETPSLIDRVRAWNAGLSPTSRFILAGILPTAIILLTGLSVLRRRTDNTIARVALRFGMAAIVLLSVSVSYVVVMHAQAAALTGSVLQGDDLATSLVQEGNSMSRRVLNLFHGSDGAEGQPASSP